MKFNDELERLKILSNEIEYDRESAHEEADNILCKILKDLGYLEIEETFKKMTKWYS